MTPGESFLFIPDQLMRKFRCVVTQKRAYTYAYKMGFKGQWPEIHQRRFPSKNRKFYREKKKIKILFAEIFFE